MLHNKYYYVLKCYSGDFNREIYGRELIGKVPLSQKGIALALQELELMSILKSKKRGTIKLYSLNREWTEIKDALTIIEITRKIEFLEDSRALAHIFQSDNRIVGIFGSYAKGTQKADSDIDVFIVGKKRENDYDKKDGIIQEKLSIKYFSEQEWTRLLKEKNNLAKEIISNHIILFGVEQFVHQLWSDYYGFN